MQRGKHPSTARTLAKHKLQGSPEQWLQSALQLHQAGHLEAAEQHYQQLLTAHPHQADALHLLGLLRHQRGDSRGGERLIRRAIASAARQPLFHTNLGEVCRAQDKSAAAIRAYQRALALEPASLNAWVGLAEVLFSTGQTVAAVAAYQQAIKLDPDDASLCNNLGNALLALGRSAAAEAAYRQALQRDADNGNALENLAKLLADKGKTAIAIAMLQRWLTPARPETDTRVALTRLLAQLQAKVWDRHGALATLQSLPIDTQEQLQIVLQHGKLLEELEQIDAALALYTRAAAQHRGTPGSALLARIGVCHELRGNASASEIAYRAALVEDSTCIAAWEGLQAMGALSDVELEQLARRVKRREFKPQERARLEFVLGHWQEQAGHYERAFAHFAAGNQAVSKERRFDPQQFSAYTEQLMSTFSAEFFAARAATEISPSGPLFIVGMPRSGTTLVEQILATHPRVSAGGERDELRRLAQSVEQLTAGRFPECMDLVDSSQLQPLSARYWDWVAPLTEAQRLFTDKLPSNYLRLGLIACLIPGARIIHCRRDPRDSCLSCFTTNFNSGQNFSYDLGHLGSAYRQYQRLMAHWQAVLPLPILEFDYEELVQNPQRAGAKLFSYCGLSWSPENIDFQQRQTPVRTASVWQVRQPLHGSSVGRWRRFERQLQPLLQAL